MSNSIGVKWYATSKQRLENAPDKMIYAVARMFMDEVISSGITPWRSGDMERSMTAKGVRKDAFGYYIGNYTDYADAVYKMNDATTNWSRKGSSSHWFDKKWAERKDSIISTCITRYKL